MSIYRYASTHPPQLDTSNNQTKGHHYHLGTSQGTSIRAQRTKYYYYYTVNTTVLLF